MATTAAENETLTRHGHGETGWEWTIEPADGATEDSVVTPSRVAVVPNDHTTRSAFSDGSWESST